MLPPTNFSKRKRHRQHREIVQSSSEQASTRRRAPARPTPATGISQQCPGRPPRRIPRQQRRIPTKQSSSFISSVPVLMLLAVVALSVAVFAPVVEAGDIGRGESDSGDRDRPWWFPSRDWGLWWDLDDAAGFGGEAGGRDGVGARGDGGGSSPWAAAAAAAGAGPARQRYREEAKLTKEFVSNWVAMGQAEEEARTGEMPRCSIDETSNATMKRLGESLDRCASPYYSMAEIQPSQLIYTEVDPAAEAAKERENARRRKEVANRTSAGHARSAGDVAADEEKTVEDVFLGIFLFLKGDFFSLELENALAAVMPAYPTAWVVKADAHVFLSFCVQYHLHTFPQVLLFKNGHLVSRYRGRRTPDGIAAWFTLQTGLLPKAIPRRALPSPPGPHPLALPGLDEPLTWLALMYALAKAAHFLYSFVKKRRTGAAAAAAAALAAGRDNGRGRGGVFGRLDLARRWLVGVFSIRRGGGGGVQGRRRGGAEAGGVVGGGVGGEGS